MKKLLFIILALVLMCGCRGGDSLPEPAPSPSSSPVVSSDDELLLTPSPEPTPTPEPTPKALDVEAGATMARFEDPESGDYLDYWLIVPENAVEGMPLLVFLHGDGDVGRPENLERDSVVLRMEEAYGDEAPFLCLLPNTRLYSWTMGSIPETLVHLIENVAESCSVNEEKIMLSGHSRGAIGTWYYISRYPELFSAAVPISCGCDELLNYEAMAGVPVWGFSGDVGRDGSHYLPAMKTIAGNIEAAGGSATIDVLEGCDHSAAEYAAFDKEVFEWLLSQ